MNNIHILGHSELLVHNLGHHLVVRNRDYLMYMLIHFYCRSSSYDSFILLPLSPIFPQSMLDRTMSCASTAVSGESNNDLYCRIIFASMTALIMAA